MDHGIGEGGDMVIHGFADHILLGADQPHIRHRIGPPFIKQPAPLPHVILHLRFCQALNLRAGMGRQGRHRRGPRLADLLRPHRGAHPLKFPGGEPGQIQRRFQQQAGLGGGHRLPPGRGFGFVRLQGTGSSQQGQRHQPRSGGTVRKR